MKIFLALFFWSSSAFASTAQSARLDYGNTNVTSSAWVQLIAAANKPVYSASVFDSSGRTMILGIGPSGSITQIIIPPGGGGFPLNLSQGQSVSIKAYNSTASSGEIDVNLFY